MSQHEKENIENEVNALIDSLKYILATITPKKIGNLEGDVNKSLQLKIALSFGLNIPETIITNNKKDLLAFAKENQKIIIKAIDYASPILKESKLYMYYSTVLQEPDFEKFPKTFLPTLFQKYIDKEIEIRSIYIHGSIYSAAIFSQMHSETVVDYRKYNTQRKNRVVPYSLPKHIEVKLIAFMDKMGLDTGSIDIIKSKDGAYYFLEVNPSGQFEKISKTCNFAIEKVIAQYFTN